MSIINNPLVKDLLDMQIGDTFIGLKGDIEFLTLKRVYGGFFSLYRGNVTVDQVIELMDISTNYVIYHRKGVSYGRKHTIKEVANNY